VNSRDEIEAAAGKHGWAARPYTDTSLTGRVYRRGDQSLLVEFTVRGAVSWATTDKRRLMGARLAEQVIAELASQPSPVTTRGRVLRALDTKGWSVKTYLSGDTIDATGPGGRQLRVEFSSRGGITWAGMGHRCARVALGKDKLGQVLKYIGS
jgi:hypothetical protein